jgi:serine/threonine protein phosphatase PrpC
MSDPDASITACTFSVPKAGHADAENEDAAAVRIDGGTAHAAVADGATEAAFARRWAQILASQAAAASVATPDALRARLPDWQTRWQEHVAARANALPWYAAAKAEDGAFATLLALALQPDGTWHAVAVGDCVLLHLREATLQQAWPIGDPGAFGDRPALVPSRPARALPPPEATRGTWQSGDALLLATDAVAAWLLRTGPARALDWTADAFATAVEAARADGTLRNDDSTLLRVEA